MALTHVAKKLLRVIYTLQTKNIPYDPTTDPLTALISFFSARKRAYFGVPFFGGIFFLPMGLTFNS